MPIEIGLFGKLGCPFSNLVSGEGQTNNLVAAWWYGTLA
jgi:hypothetical protein